MHFITCSIPILTSLYKILSISADSAKIPLYTLLTFRTGFSTQGSTIAGHRSHLVSPLIKGCSKASQFFKKAHFFFERLSAETSGVLCHILHYSFKKQHIYFFSPLSSVSVAAPQTTLYKPSQHPHGTKSDRKHLLLHWAVLSSIYTNMGTFSKVSRWLH